MARRSGGRGLMRMMYGRAGRFAIAPAGWQALPGRLGLEQHALALGRESVERILREGRAQLHVADVGEQAPVPGADAELKVRQHPIADERLGLAAHTSPP